MKTLIITEKSSQAKDMRAALGDRFGQILPAEGHLLRLAEPEEVNAEWKCWSCTLLKPDGLYPTRPAADGNKPSKLKAIAAALKSCDQVILATDCDREGQLIGQEILDHLRYRGRVQRALFTAQDPKTLRQAFAQLKPNEDLRPLYEAAVARQQADQIFNLSLTRTAQKCCSAPVFVALLESVASRRRRSELSACVNSKSATSDPRITLRSWQPRQSLPAALRWSCPGGPPPDHGSPSGRGDRPRRGGTQGPPRRVGGAPPSGTTAAV